MSKICPKCQKSLLCWEPYFQHYGCRQCGYVENKGVGEMSDIERALIHYDGNNDMPYCDLVWQALKEKKERDNPRPLTIEQLKERDGKPVWVIDNRGDIPSEWNIVVAKTGQLRDKDGRFCLFVDTCMTVYDHEPKHQTK